MRGGILDVFPPTEEHPLRVEFFGDTVEEIRYFRSPTSAACTAPTTACGRRRAASCCSPRRCGSGPRSWPTEHPGLSDVLSKLADGITVEGMEAFAPVLADRMELLLDYVPAGGIVLACDPERIRARAADLVSTSQEFLEASWVNAAAGGEVPIDLGAAAFRPITEVRSVAGDAGLPWWTITPFARPWSADRAPAARPALIPGTQIALNPADATDSSPGDTVLDADDEAGRDAYRMEASPAEAYRGDTRRVVADVRRWLDDRWRVVLVTEGHGPAQRLVELLRGESLGARLGDDDSGEPPEAGLVHVATGTIAHGFTWPAVRLAVLTEADLAGQRTAGAGHERMPSRRRGGIDPLRLAPGDYVVHEQHGVGRYLEMTSRTVSRARPASTWSSSTRRASAASRRTGCTCPPTSWTRSPGTPAARRPACTGSAAPTGPRPRAGRARRCGRSPPS